MTKTSFGRRACGLVSITLLSTLTLASACDGDAGEEDTAAATDTGGSDDQADAEASGDDSDDDSGGDSGGDSSGDSGGDETGTDETIEIEGVWNEFFPPDGEVVHTITNTTWDQESTDFGVNLTLESFDNGTRSAIAYDGAAYSKLQWTWTDDDTRLWYCTAVFSARTAEEAQAGPDADATDPANGGCGGFSWSNLTPAR